MAHILAVSARLTANHVRIRKKREFGKESVVYEKWSDGVLRWYNNIKTIWSKLLIGLKETQLTPETFIHSGTSGDYKILEYVLYH